MGEILTTHAIPDNAPLSDGPPTATLADVAQVIFSRLAAATGGDIAELAIVCQAVASTAVAGCYGRPGVAHDALLNAIWASVAAVVPAEGEDAALPSLYDTLRGSGGYCPYRLLKRYLRTARLPFRGSRPHAELMAAIPNKVPPRLIAVARGASPSARLAALERGLAARQLPLPADDAVPEGVVVREHLAGTLSCMDYTQLLDFLTECAFFRQYTHLEDHLRWGIGLAAAAEGLGPEEEVSDEEAVNAAMEVDLDVIISEDVLRGWGEARFDAVWGVVLEQGPAAALALPGVPASLLDDIEAVASQALLEEHEEGSDEDDFQDAEEQ